MTDGAVYPEHWPISRATYCDAIDHGWFVAEPRLPDVDVSSATAMHLLQTARWESGGSPDLLAALLQPESSRHPVRPTRPWVPGAPQPQHMLDVQQAENFVGFHWLNTALGGPSGPSGFGLSAQLNWARLGEAGLESFAPRWPEPHYTPQPFFQSPAPLP